MRLAAIFGVLSIVLIAAGWVYVSRLQANARMAAHRELSAIADLKLRQIISWRDERLADARFFSNARFVSEDMEAFLANPNSEANRASVENWLRLLKGNDRYFQVAIFDLQGNELMSLPGKTPEPPDYLNRLLQEVKTRRETVITDLHQHETNGLVHLDIMFPVMEDGEAPSRKIIAAVFLRLDARQFIFPLLRSWPTPTRTAETFLVREDQEQVLYLSDLRDAPDAALNLRMPLSTPDLPAARVLGGDTNVIQGRDYRGEKVVAVGGLVPGTSWAMVAKVEQEEIYASLREQTRAAITVMASLLVASAFLVGLLWHQRHAHFLRREVFLEREQSASSQRFALLMRAANDIIMVLDSEGRVLQANERALEHYGYTHEEMLTKSLGDLRAPKSLPRLPADLRQVREHGAAFYQSEHQRKDGSTFDVEVSSRAIKIEGAALIMSVVRDITERRLYEREIERLNRLYAAQTQLTLAVLRARSGPDLKREVCRVLVETGKFPMAWIGWIDPATKQVIAQEQYGDRGGYLQRIKVFADAKSGGRGPIATAIQDNRAVVLNDCLSDPRFEPWRAEAEQCGWRSLATFPIHQAGQTQGVLTVYSEEVGFFGVKERQLLEEAAAEVSFGLDLIDNERRRQEAEDLLRIQAAALESAGNGIAILELDGTIRWANSALEKISGYTEQELLGRKPRVLKRGPAEEPFFDAVWDKIAAGQPWRGEVTSQRKDGIHYIEDVTVTPVKDPAGNISHFVAVTQDVTARVQAEIEVRQARDELARANATLERRVAERTAQLLEANANLQTFAHSAAHDMRSPLRAIQSFSTLTLEEYGEVLGADGKSLLERVTQSAAQMGRLLDDLLEYSKMSGEELRLQELDLNQAVSEALALLDSEIRAKKAQVTVHPDLPCVMAHSATAVVIVNNMVSNALKFASPGVTPRIGIRAEMVFADSGERFARLWVEDNGIGIADADVEKLFRAFQRLHGKAAYPGTGLGLAIVRKGAERMGGRVGVESEPGKGSRFWVELRAAEKAH